MLILKLLVLIMSVQLFGQDNVWLKFNSSLLIEVTRPNGVFTCTGVAVTPRLLVTAAHCLEGDVKKVRVFTQDAYDPKMPSIETKGYELHPEYNRSQSRYHHDIAKLILATELPPEISIQPILKTQDLDGKIYRFGFGMRNNRNARTVITPKYRRWDQKKSILELDDTFSYSGDSGGPIFITKGPVVQLVAIHSTFSHGPEGRFSFNPVIADYLSWIFPN